jgi:hypothetical protein
MTKEEFGTELFDAISTCAKVQQLLRMISVDVNKGRDTADLSAQYGREKAKAKKLLEADALSTEDAVSLVRQYPWLMT